MKYKSKLRGIGLQFFADEPSEDNTTTKPDNNTTNTNTTDTGTQNQTPPPKTFTQDEVNRMMSSEKKQGRQAVLKALGLDPNDKDAEKKAKAILDAQKTDSEKAAEALKTAQTAQSEAEQRAIAAERKVQVLEYGCKREFIEEVTALAAVKVTDTVTFEEAVKAVKGKCATFFEEEEPDQGTGSGAGHKRKNNDTKPGSLGERLAKSVVSGNTQKNPYFKN